MLPIRYVLIMMVCVLPRVILAFQDSPTSQPAPTVDVYAFATAIQDALNHRDAKKLTEAFHVDRLLERTFAGVEADKDAMRGFINGTRSHFDYGTSLCANFKSSAWAELLRLQPTDDVATESSPRTYFALLRIAYSALAFDYYQFRIEVIDGKCFVTDAYYHSTGQSQSESMRSFFHQTQVTNVGEDGVIERAHQLRDDMNDMLKHERAGEFAEALRALDRVIDLVGSTKNMMIRKIQFATSSGQMELAAAAREKFEKAFPGDPALPLMTFDMLIAQDKLSEAVAALAEIRSAMFADSYLDYVEGVLLSAMGKPDAARAAIEKSVKNGFMHTGPYWQLVALAVDRKDHDEVARILMVIRDDLGVALPDIEKIDAYEEFVASEAYEKLNRGDTESGG